MAQSKYTITDDDEQAPSTASSKFTVGDEDEETPQATEENLPGSTPRLREAVNKGVAKMTPPTKFEEANQPGYDFQPHKMEPQEYLGLPPAHVLGAVAKGAGDVIKSGAQGLYDVGFGEANPETGELEHGLGGLVNLNTKGEYAPVEKAKALGKRYLVDPAAAEFEQAGKAPTALEAGGHALAGAIPLVGPWAASLGERAGTGDISGAGGEAIGGVLGGEAMAHPVEVAKAARDVGGAAVGKTLDALGNPLTLGLSGEEKLTKGVRPRARAQGWQEAISNPEVQRQIVEQNKQVPIENVADFHDAIGPMKDKLWDGQVQPALDRQGPRPVDMQPAADGIRKAITPEMREFHPERVAQLEDLANKLEKSRTVQEASNLQKYANQQLEGYYAKYPTARRSSFATNPETMAWELARRGIREQLLKTLEGSNETQIGPAREAYGHLTTLEKELERKVNPNERKAPTGLYNFLGTAGGLASLLAGHGLGAAAIYGYGRLADYFNRPDTLIRRGIKNLTPAERPEFTPPEPYREPLAQFPQGQGALTASAATAPVQGPPPPPKPFELGNEQPRNAPGAGLWEQQAGPPPNLTWGGPRAPYNPPIGPEPAAAEAPPKPIVGEQQRFNIPEGPQQAPLFNLQPPPLEGKPPNLKTIGGGEIGAPQPIGGPGREGPLAKIQTTKAGDLNIGDSFVDDKGDPRRVVDITEDGKIKTADHTMRTYDEGEIQHIGELNSPKARLAQGGMFHPGPGEGFEEEEAKAPGKIGEEKDWRPAGLEKGIAKEDAVDAKVPLGELSVPESAYNRASKDISVGRASRVADEPILIFHNTSNGQFLVEDGMHRVVEAYRRGDENIPAKIYSGDYSETVPSTPEGTKMDLTPLTDVEKDEPPAHYLNNLEKLGLDSDIARDQWADMSEKERGEELERVNAQVEGKTLPQKPRTTPVQSPADAIAALKERVKDQTHEGAERDYKIWSKGELDPNKFYATTFLLDDGSAVTGDKGIQSHMQLAREIGQGHLNDANAIRMVAPDAYELHGPPSEQQLAEMARYRRGLSNENVQNVHDPQYVYWDFYPPEVTGYSADAIGAPGAEKTETGAGRFADFQRAIDKYYYPTLDVSPKGSSVGLMENPLTVKAAGAKPSTAEVAKAFNQYTKKEIGPMKLGKAEPEAMVERARQLAEDEAKYQIARDNSGAAWYTTQMAEHDKYAREMRPELNDPAKLSIFKMAEAVLSSGLKPYANFKATIKAWDHYADTGKFPEFNPETKKSWGPRNIAAYGDALSYINDLVKEKGEQGASDWLLEKHPIRELREYNKNVSGKMDDEVPGAMILGPKRGAFAQNLHGIESPFTADMWVARTWNRWMGTLEPDTTTGEISSDAPRNDTERKMMAEAFGKAAEKFGLTTSAMQAVLWYYEQALYDAHGTPKESWSFSDAAKRARDEEAGIATTTKSGKAVKPLSKPKT